MEKPKNKEKISIVFEDKENGEFHVYMTGLSRDLNYVPDEEKSPAEHWSSEGFRIIIDVLRQVGVLKKSVPTQPNAILQ